MGREESKASPVLLNNVFYVFSYDRDNNKRNQMSAGLSLKFFVKIKGIFWNIDKVQWHFVRFSIEGRPQSLFWLILKMLNTHCNDFALSSWVHQAIVFKTIFSSMAVVPLSLEMCKSKKAQEKMATIVNTLHFKCNRFWTSISQKLLNLSPPFNGNWILP